MSWLEQAIRKYEHRRWTTDDNRRVHPFEWGLQHIGGSAHEADPRAWLDRFVEQTIAASEDWFHTGAAPDYRLENGELRFTSAVASPYRENNTVVARWFPAKKSGPAVIVMPHWNAKPAEGVAICRWLNTLGISALRLSMPYHDARKAPGYERADQLVGTNIGLTLQANQQAVKDVRRCLRWLEGQGYGKLGLLGSSIGSSVAFITMCHDPAVRAGAFLHVSTYFGEVVRTGMTTMHVWEGLRQKVGAEELTRFWAPISPYPYMHRLRRSGKKALLVTGKYDPTFWPDLSLQAVLALQQEGVEFNVLHLPCGHYSLGIPPFSWAAGYNFGVFLFQNLT
jgi:hypothetical protein